MGSSLLTNRASMTALQTLRTISGNMESTQNRVSTGRRITEAADNTAYWAISSSMRSDCEATGVIKDALELGKARVDQAYVSNQQIRKELQEVKNLVISANGMTGDDQKKIETTIKTKLDNIRTAIESGALNGANLLAQDGTTAINIPASFRRKGTTITVDKISMNAADLQLAGIGSNGNADFSKGQLAELLKSDAKLFEVPTQIQASKNQNTDSTHATEATKVLALTGEQLDAIAAKVQKGLDVLSKVDSILGSVKKQVDSQIGFVHKLVDNLDKSVGALVDADMNAESARLSALQVQQQLAVQSLSIANQSSQHLLSLFRN